jgi:hypothetical protein
MAPSRRLDKSPPGAPRWINVDTPRTRNNSLVVIPRRDEIEFEVPCEHDLDCPMPPHETVNPATNDITTDPVPSSPKELQPQRFSSNRSLHDLTPHCPRKRSSMQHVTHAIGMLAKQPVKLAKQPVKLAKSTTKHLRKRLALARKGRDSSDDEDCVEEELAELPAYPPVYFPNGESEDDEFGLSSRSKCPTSPVAELPHVSRVHHNRDAEDNYYGRLEITELTPGMSATRPHTPPKRKQRSNIGHVAHAVGVLAYQPVKLAKQPVKLAKSTRKRLRRRADENCTRKRLRRRADENCTRNSGDSEREDSEHEESEHEESEHEDSLAEGMAELPSPSTHCPDFTRNERAYGAHALERKDGNSFLGTPERRTEAIPTEPQTRGDQPPPRVQRLSSIAQVANVIGVLAKQPVKLAKEPLKLAKSTRKRLRKRAEKRRTRRIRESEDEDSIDGSELPPPLFIPDNESDEASETFCPSEVGRRTNGSAEAPHQMRHRHRSYDSYDFSAEFQETRPMSGNRAIHREPLNAREEVVWNTSRMTPQRVSWTGAVLSYA